MSRSFAPASAHVARVRHRHRTTPRVTRSPARCWMAASVLSGAWGRTYQGDHQGTALASRPACGLDNDGLDVGLVAHCHEQGVPTATVIECGGGTSGGVSRCPGSREPVSHEYGSGRPVDRDHRPLRCEQSFGGHRHDLPPKCRWRGGAPRPRLDREAFLPHRHHDAWTAAVGDEWLRRVSGDTVITTKSRVEVLPPETSYTNDSSGVAFGAALARCGRPPVTAATTGLVAASPSARTGGSSVATGEAQGNGGTIAVGGRVATGASDPGSPRSGPADGPAARPGRRPAAQATAVHRPQGRRPPTSPCPAVRRYQPARSAGRGRRRAPAGWLCSATIPGHPNLRVPQAHVAHTRWWSPWRVCHPSS